MAIASDLRDIERAPTILAVDWSGAIRGVRRKLWLAEVREGRLARLECGRDRAELVAHFIECARADRDLVVGLDFAFSFPEWFVLARGVGAARGMWELAAVHGEEWLADCAFPFWGRKGKRKPSSDDTPTPFRRTEGERLPVRGIAPKSVFQIGGAGAVGTGSLRGMPWLRDLADAGFAIWPFDDARLPLALEIYPRFLTGRVTKSSARARELFLAQRFGAEDRALLACASASEDAFDAAVSALVMSRHAAAIARLRADDDATYRVEGRIWTPLEDPLFERG
jgi:hypothetical protein